MLYLSNGSIEDISNNILDKLSYYNPLIIQHIKNGAYSSFDKNLIFDNALGGLLVSFK